MNAERPDIVLLIVTGVVGVSVLPMRFRAPSEIVILILGAPVG